MGSPFIKDRALTPLCLGIPYRRIVPLRACIAARPYQLFAFSSGIILEFSRSLLGRRRPRGRLPPFVQGQERRDRVRVSLAGGASSTILLHSSTRRCRALSSSEESSSCRWLAQSRRSSTVFWNLQ